MIIVDGLFPRMVLQRGKDNQSDAAIKGTTRAAGNVTVTVRKAGRILAGFSKKPCGIAVRGAFEARIQGLPAGGPYDIELAVAPRAGTPESVRAADVLVGDVWILAGQSNMQGCGFLKDRAAPHRMVRAFYMDDRWAAAEDPVHNLSDAVDPVHAELCGGQLPPPDRKDFGTGPGVYFAQDLFRRTGVPQGLLACAHGGTAMSQWSPALVRTGRSCLYGALLRRVRKNGGRVAGVCWYQGESDATDKDAPLYTQRMRRLVRALRLDLEQPGLPWLVMQLGRVFGQDHAAALWNDIREQQRRLPDRMRNLAVVPTFDLELDDPIHIAGFAHRELGRRMAAEAEEIQARRRPAHIPHMAPEGLSIRNDPIIGMGEITVAFRNVRGGLVAPPQRAIGFAIRKEGRALPIRSVRLAGNQAVLSLFCLASELHGAALYYGYGCDGYVNLRDAAGRALPAFGPIRIVHPRAAAPFIQSWRLSPFLPAPASWRAVRLPEAGQAEKWPVREFAGVFSSLHPEIQSFGAEPKMFYYACSLDCVEDMRLEFLAGYDGPITLWLDGRKLFADPQGANPAIPESRAIRAKVTRGTHDLVVALGTNLGKAWGIFLQVGRCDLPRKLLQSDAFLARLPAVRV